MEPAAGKPETSYLKYLAFTQQLELEWGMRAEMDNKTALTAAWRDHDAGGTVHGRSLRQLRVHGAVSVVARVRQPCLQRAGQPGASEPGRPRRRGCSRTPADFLAYTPHPPFQFGHIDFNDGGRVLMEFTDTDQDELKRRPARAHGVPHQGIRQQAGFAAISGRPRPCVKWPLTPEPPEGDLHRGQWNTRQGCHRRHGVFASFGERWDSSPEDLVLEAFNEAIADAGIGVKQIEAAWLGVCLEENNVGKTAGPLAAGAAPARHRRDAG